MFKTLKRSAKGARVPHEKDTAGMATVKMAVPAHVVIPMQMHIGAPAEPVVKKGDQVFVGTMIGKAGGFVSANIHSSVSGKVVDVAPMRMVNGPVVTAVAQEYDDQGQELPDRVSLQYYELGLEETAVPVMSTVTSAFGFRDHPVDGEYTFHNAVDIGVSTGTDVLAFADGTVRYIGEDDVFGLYLKIDHANGVSTFYAHCDELLVSKGDTVTCGQVVAKSGETGNATGPHLHFSIEKDGIRLDPEYYLDLDG